MKEMLPGFGDRDSGIGLPRYYWDSTLTAPFALLPQHQISRMKPFEELRVFREAIALMVEVYRLTEAFPRHEMYGLTSQVRRSSGSVVAHIAEADGRLSFGEKRQLLSQGRGSLYETKAHLIASRELQYITQDQFAAIDERTVTVTCLMAGFIRYVQRREAQAKLRKTPGSPIPEPRSPNP